MADIKTAAVLVCAGSGSRMKGHCNDKLLMELDGLPAVVHTLLAYEKAKQVGLIVVAVKEENAEVYRSFSSKYGIKKLQLVVAGGETRMQSVLNGVSAVPDEYDMVAIGDGARPLIRWEDIDKTIEAAKISGAAALGCLITDTVKKIENGKLVETVPRENLVGIQTPQVFLRQEYLETAQKAVKTDHVFTDDASVYEYYGKTVTFVEGHRDNLKTTVPEDIPVIKAIMEERQ